MSAGRAGRAGRAGGSLLLRDVEVDGRRVDVRVEAGRVAQVAPGLRRREAREAGHEEVVDGRGGALLPGLHDHHVHLLAMAAASASVAVGPADVGDRAGLAAALAGAPSDRAGWVRAVGYHEAVAGPLDRDVLDALAPGRKVRVQHRSGQLWCLSSPALEAVLGDGLPPACVELDDRGRPTGRIWRGDDWLRSRLPDPAPGEVADRLAAIGSALAAAGVTGLTDATPHAEQDPPAVLVDAVAAGRLPQRLVLMSAGPLRPGPSGSPGAGPVQVGPVQVGPVKVGPVKVVLDDARLPGLDAVVDAVRGARRQGRAVAVHCVTLAELALAVTAFEVAGPVPGDRIEHGGVVPRDWMPRLAALGLTVVTQPGFVAERGDQYRRDVDPADLDALYPCASLLAAGVAVGAGSDAPYGRPDPWAAMRAAVDRTTGEGVVLGVDERVGPDRALALFLGRSGAPGGPPRRVEPGAPADLCLLHVPWAEARAVLDATLVAATVIAGRVVPREAGT